MIELSELRQALGDLEESPAMNMLDIFVGENPAQEEIQRVVTACQQGMEIVGDRYEKGEYFVGDLIFAGDLLSRCIGILKPLLGDGAGITRGTIVLGTVEGDIHDIGKNIFKSMCEAAGFLVVDVGVDQPARVFVDAVRDYKPQILALSGVLTLAVDAMKRTVDALIEEGLRDSVRIQIGGNAVSADACKYIGADAWSRNAAESVKICNKWTDPGA